MYNADVLYGAVLSTNFNLPYLIAYIQEFKTLLALFVSSTYSVCECSLKFVLLIYIAYFV